MNNERRIYLRFIDVVYVGNDSRKTMQKIELLTSALGFCTHKNKPDFSIRRSANEKLHQLTLFLIIVSVNAN